MANRARLPHDALRTMPDVQRLLAAVRDEPRIEFAMVATQLDSRRPIGTADRT